MKTTDFGFERVSEGDKARRVAHVFSSVANRYDLMNDLMSWGLHRLWKRFAVAMAGIRPGDRVLDLAGGTGDLGALITERVGTEGWVVLADINADMLRLGRDRLLNRGMVSGLAYVQANAESLPFEDNAFDVLTLAFGLRNVTEKNRALAAMCRVLRPGGVALILEFSHVALPLLRTLYDRYSFAVLPRLGALVAGDGDSYRYLVESIRTFPEQAELAQMMAAAGFGDVRWNNLSAGIVAVHRGYKL
ncbi:MAG: bifunctional demethylmenaquinone methyltransferase/2-methoxy-6-polyprenyl-1,4-benzoquinol methylase UbiE [Gammaproteobacteria bacterium]